MLTMPGYWKHVGENPREKVVFSLKRIDGLVVTLGFSVKAGDTQRGIFPSSEVHSAVGFVGTMPREAHQKYTNNHPLAAVACICAPGGEEDEACPLHGKEARAAAAKAAADAEARRPGGVQPGSFTLNSTTDRMTSSAPELPPAPSSAIIVSWQDSEVRMWVPARNPIEAARMLDRVLPLDPGLCIVPPPGWPWPVA